MIPIEQISNGTLIFLDCGCGACRFMGHPTGTAVLVKVFAPCEAHAAEPEARSVPKGEMVSPFVRTAVNLKPHAPS